DTPWRRSRIRGAAGVAVGSWPSISSEFGDTRSLPQALAATPAQLATLLRQALVGFQGTALAVKPAKVCPWVASSPAVPAGRAVASVSDSLGWPSTDSRRLPPSTWKTRSWATAALKVGRDTLPTLKVVGLPLTTFTMLALTWPLLSSLR